MTPSRDLDQLVQTYLESGPAVLSDRVVAAVRGDIHVKKQRVLVRPPGGS